MQSIMPNELPPDESYDEEGFPPELDQAIARQLLGRLPPEVRPITLALLRRTSSDLEFLRKQLAASTNPPVTPLSLTSIAFNVAEVRFSDGELQSLWNKLVAPVIAARAVKARTSAPGWPPEVLAGPLTIALDATAERTRIIRLAGQPSIDTIVLAPQDANARTLSAAIVTIWADRRASGCSLDAPKLMPITEEERDLLVPSWRVQMEETLQALTDASPSELPQIGTLAAVPFTLTPRRLL
jgi:hypothetical protein